MKKIKYQLYGLITTVFVFFAPHFVSASAKIEEYKIETFKSYFLKDFSLNPVSSDNTGFILNAIANMLFSVTKQIVNIADALVNYLYSLNVIDVMIDTFETVSNALWTNLNAQLGSAFIVVTIIVIAISFFLKGGQDAGRKVIKFLIASAIAFGFTSFGADYLRTVNQVASEVEVNIMQIGTSLLGKEQAEDTTTTVRNLLFSTSIEKPFYLMNYGTPDGSEIHNYGVQAEGAKTDRRHGLIAKENSTGEYKKIQENLKKEKDVYENFFVTTDSLPDKIVTALTSIIFALFNSVPLVIFSFMNFLSQMIALILFVIFPISAILSYLPWFSNSSPKMLVMMGATLAVKIFTGVLVMLYCYVTTIIETLLPISQDASMYFLQMIAMAVVVVVAYKKRNSLVSMITGGAVTAVAGMGMSNLLDKVPKPEFGSGGGEGEGEGGSEGNPDEIPDDRPIEIDPNEYEADIEKEIEDIPMSDGEDETEEISLENEESDTAENDIQEEPMAVEIQDWQGEESDSFSEDDLDVNVDIPEDEFVQTLDVDELAELKHLSLIEGNLDEISSNTLDISDNTVGILNKSMQQEKVYGSQIISEESFDMNNIYNFNDYVEEPRSHEDVEEFLNELDRMRG